MGINNKNDDSDFSLCYILSHRYLVCSVKFVTVSPQACDNKPVILNINGRAKFTGSVFYQNGIKKTYREKLYMPKKINTDVVRQQFSWGRADNASPKVTAVITDAQENSSKIRKLIIKLNKRLLRLSSD